MDRIKKMEAMQLKKDMPEFGIGDTVKVYSKIREEGKTRLQAFEGVVMKFKGSSLRKTFTVRRISYGEGIEKTFPMHSPLIDNIEVVKKGVVRRAKLYYLRKKFGKKSRIRSLDTYGTESDTVAGDEEGESGKALDGR